MYLKQRLRLPTPGLPGPAVLPAFCRELYPISPEFSNANPKVALFFLAIFSHLIDSDSSWLETGLMGIAAAAIDACWYVSVALMLAGTGLMNALRSSETTIRRISGGLLILIALYFFAVTIRGLLL